MNLDTLLIVQGYPKAQERIERHWPWFQRSGCPILGVDRLNGHVHWPDPPPLMVRHSGQDGYVGGRNLLDLLLNCFHFGLETDLESFCVVECDSIFLRPLPKHPGGLVATLGGYRTEGFHGTRFFHTPWWADRPTAERILECGQRMLDCNLFERGFPDRFLGLMVDLFDLPWSPAPAFSCNEINTPALLEAARLAIRQGICYAHGVKTAEQLQALTEGLIESPQPHPNEASPASPSKPSA